MSIEFLVPQRLWGHASLVLVDYWLCYLRGASLLCLKLLLNWGLSIYRFLFHDLFRSLMTGDLVWYHLIWDFPPFVCFIEGLTCLVKKSFVIFLFLFKHSLLQHRRQALHISCERLQNLVGSIAELYVSYVSILIIRWRCIVLNFFFGDVTNFRETRLVPL